MYVYIYHPLKYVQWVVLLAGRSVEWLAGHHISSLSSIGQIDGENARSESRMVSSTYKRTL